MQGHQNKRLTITLFVCLDQYNQSTFFHFETMRLYKVKALEYWHLAKMARKTYLTNYGAI